MDVLSLLKEAFFSAEARRATWAIEHARARVTAEAKVGAFSLEVVVPKRPDEQWFWERESPVLIQCYGTGERQRSAPQLR